MLWLDLYVVNLFISAYHFYYCCTWWKNKKCYFCYS